MLQKNYYLSFIFQKSEYTISLSKFFLDFSSFFSHAMKLDKHYFRHRKLSYWWIVCISLSLIPFRHARKNFHNFNNVSNALGIIYRRSFEQLQTWRTPRLSSELWFKRPLKTEPSPSGEVTWPVRRAILIGIRCVRFYQQINSWRKRSIGWLDKWLIELLV